MIIILDRIQVSLFVCNALFSELVHKFFSDILHEVRESILCKIQSLIFASNDLKWSVLCLANFLCKSHIWKNSYNKKNLVIWLVQSFYT